MAIAIITPAHCLDKLCQSGFGSCPVALTSIGMRKLIGASNVHLWHQSLAESCILNVLALIASVALYLIFKSTFAQIFSIPMAMHKSQPDTWLSFHWE
jgi:hypothetical protein